MTFEFGNLLSLTIYVFLFYLNFDLRPHKAVLWLALKQEQRRKSLVNCLSDVTNRSIKEHER